MNHSNDVSPCCEANDAFERGLARLESGDLDEAQREFDTAVGLQPQFPRAICGRGLAAIPGVIVLSGAERGA